MYTDYFKLSEPPFSLTPDPRFLFMSERHREGLAHLFYGVQQPGGFVQLTGDIGSGKTTLCRCLVKQLPPGTDVALILNPRLTVIELLATVCEELGVSYPKETASIKVLIDALNQRLLESHEKGRKTVLILDEAQNLNEDVLEQIRLLTNLETSKEKLLQIILIGQPELLAVLKRRELRQIAQRITARYHLLALSRRETYAYIQHRLLVAGRRDPLFTNGAMRCVHRLSSGVPRVINIICDRALLGAYALDRQRVSAGIVRRASRETRGVLSWRRRFRIAWIAGAIALAALVVTAVIFLAPADLSALRRKAGIDGTRSVSPIMEEAGRNSSMPAKKPTGVNERDPDTADGSFGRNPAHFPGQSEVRTAGPGLNLADVLMDSSLPVRSNSAFANLYDQWGIIRPSNPEDLGCKAIQTQGYECLSQVGNWLKLRRYDLPAILDIVLPDGKRRQATLIELADEKARLAIANKEYIFPLSEINQVWDGSFLLFWKPPFPSRQLSLGDSGKDVLWVRKALDVLDGKAEDNEGSELFDEDLRRRVLAFQRNQSLIQDGYIGNETWVRLTIALRGPGAPSILGRARSLPEN